MCGISGIFMKDGKAVDPALLAAFERALHHRGPDHDGRFLSGPFALAHNRLSIVDLVTGDQPLFGEKGAVLAANGEIYNAPQLRDALKGAHRFNTLSDCEPAVHLFEIKDLAYADDLRGMYAIALWDPARQRLVLTRDPFGIKPLYYVETDALFAFASEISALLDAGLAPRAVNPLRRDELLQLKYTLGDETIIPGIKRLLPGQTLVVENAQVVAERRIEALPRGVKARPPSDPVAAFDAVMTDSVQAHLIADVPVSLFLSGGVDSSILLILMQRLMQDVTAITVGYEDESLDRSVDESRAALAHAARHGVKAERIAMTAEDFYTLAPRIAAAMDDPTCDAAVLPSYMLGKAAAYRGLKVALCGEGADELFGGYRRYRPKLVDQLIRREKKKRGTFSKTDLDPLFGQAWRDEHKRLGVEAGRGFSSKIQALQAADVAQWLPNDLLVKLDRCLMAHAVEGRTPYLDRAVAAFAVTLPDDLRVKGDLGKILMRQWLAGADPAYPAFAKKKGFITPVGRWIAAEAATLGPLLAKTAALCEIGAQGMAAHVLERAERDSQPAWSLLFYALWHAHHIQGLPVDGDLESVLASARQ